jgi:hypothetical protein
MDAVWLDRHEGVVITPSDEPQPADVRRIRSLDEVVQILVEGGDLPRGEISEPPSASTG